jgi:hypothetical protein
MKGWAEGYLAGAVLAGLTWLSLPESLMSASALIIFFVFAVALILLALAQFVAKVRR